MSSQSLHLKLKKKVLLKLYLLQFPFKLIYLLGTASSENSRRLWLFPGSLRGVPRKIAGKPREYCWKIFPNREMLQILGFRALEKANLPGTLGRHCLDLVPTFRAGCFLKSTVPAFSSFSDSCMRASLQEKGEMRNCKFRAVTQGEATQGTGCEGTS